jgi:PHD/YefM family antitoxin component YafN of YafNO toxin-antitoxin module
MKLVPLAEVRNHFTRYLKTSKREPVFITRKGRIAAVLEHLTDDAVEDYLLERSPKLRAMLERMRQQKGGISLSDYRKSRGL